MTKVVILDRDGVINRDSEHYVRTPGEWIPLPGSIEAIARLARAGFGVYVATNQSGIDRGLFDQHALAAMHDKCARLVAAAGGRIAGFYHCPHRPDDGCACRKPRPGMIRAIVADAGVDPRAATVVGDRYSDLAAGSAGGCSTLILVRSGNGEATLAEMRARHDPLLARTIVCADLDGAAHHISAQP